MPLMVKTHLLMPSRGIRQPGIGCFLRLIEVPYLISNQKNIRICQDLGLMICSQILGQYKIWKVQRLWEVLQEDQLLRGLIGIE
jgi:hypothetical protein